MSRSDAAPDPLWVFGYGSLVWRPAFEHLDRQPAWIAGYARRFWQGSTDHRGVPGRPGRVATLVPDADSVCWGTAYRVAPDAAEAVLEALDHRERGGFVRHVVEARLARVGRDPDATVRALVYWATPDNPNYLGPASLESIAEQIRISIGPSGHNIEYVIELADALNAMGARDDHVQALSALLADAREA